MALGVDDALLHELRLDDCDGVGDLHEVGLGDRVRPRLADSEPVSDGELEVERDTVAVAVDDGVTVEQYEGEPLDIAERDAVEDGLTVWEATGEPDIVVSGEDDTRDAPVTVPEMVAVTESEDDPDPQRVGNIVTETVAQPDGLWVTVDDGEAEPLTVRATLPLAKLVSDCELDTVEDADAVRRPVADAVTDPLSVTLPERLPVVVALPLTVDVSETHAVSVRDEFIVDEVVPENDAEAVAVVHTDGELVAVGEFDAAPLDETEREFVEVPRSDAVAETVAHVDPLAVLLGDTEYDAVPDPLGVSDDVCDRVVDAVAQKETVLVPDEVDVDELVEVAD